tara:strand:- start:333 stop:734 length:402 start_codon:yes stop_codon:yes gene_type:complete
LPLATKKVRQVSALFFGIAFVSVGLQHFTNTRFFIPIVPEILGVPEFWVYLSGLVEVILGIGMIAPVSRRRAAFSTAIFLVMVYWANLNMWIHDISIGDTNFTTSGHILRASAQIVMIWFSLWIAEWPVKNKM